ncbi:hypothetical protein TNCV_569281 [Trichonephila clavipes]|nr:hypothetical protein TNCV_569281 [Trichonephila clavipes]
MSGIPPVVGTIFVANKSPVRVLGRKLDESGASGDRLCPVPGEGGGDQYQNEVPRRKAVEGCSQVERIQKRRRRYYGHNQIMFQTPQEFGQIEHASPRLTAAVALDDLGPTKVSKYMQISTPTFMNPDIRITSPSIVGEMPSSSLDRRSKLRSPSPIAPVLSNAMLTNIHSELIGVKRGHLAARHHLIRGPVPVRGPGVADHCSR